MVEPPKREHLSMRVVQHEAGAFRQSTCGKAFCSSAVAALVQGKISGLLYL
jgi:hypothetical protein